MDFTQLDDYKAWKLKMDILDKLGSDSGNTHAPSKARMFAHEVMVAMKQRIEHLEDRVAWYEAGSTFVHPQLEESGAE
jgi:hypothetical protein